MSKKPITCKDTSDTLTPTKKKLLALLAAASHKTTDEAMQTTFKALAKSILTGSPDYQDDVMSTIQMMDSME